MKYLKTTLIGRMLLTSLLSISALTVAQAATISGKVVSSKDSAPIIGATVTIDGTTIGTATDLDGNFTMSNAPESGVVTFSYLGCAPQSLAIEDSKVYSVALASDVQEIDEVVVVGYGTMRKADLTGSIRSVDGGDIESRKNMQVASSLQGAMSGVTVTNSSTSLGGESDILIRGVTTIGDSSPLIIVDGVSVDDINQISPSDIESLTVLKDAASASIYGSRAASGVILITTKRAKAGSVNVNYSYELGIDKAIQQPVHQNAVEYMTSYNELMWNDLGNGENQYPTYSKDLIDNYAKLNAENPDKYPDTDWRDMIFNDNAVRQTHNISISAGSEHVRSNISLRYDDANGLLDNYTYERITARSNNDFTINKMISATLDMNFIRTHTTTPASNPAGGPDYMPSIYAAVWSDGRLGDGKTGTNPYAQLVASGQSDYFDNMFGGKASLNISPIEGLKLTAILAPSFNFDKSKQFRKKISIYDANDPTQFISYVQGNTSTSLTENRDEDFSLTTQFLANYNKSFNDNKSNLSAMVGYENFYYNNESLMASRDQYVLQNYPYLDLGPEAYRDNSGAAYETAYRSVFARAVYSYDNRYMIQGNLRYDGSSRFHKDYRWALFPSVSAGWTISEEDFMQNQNVASFMKLRLSYGTLGNERIGNYPYQATMAFGSSLLYKGSTVSPEQSAAQSAYAIQDISWETTRSINVGLDVNFFDNRLAVTGEYYVKKTSDMLLKVEIPGYMGYGNPEQNSGDMNTNGYDIDIAWHDTVGDFSYNIAANLSQFKSVMGDLDDTQMIANDQITIQGSGFKEWYGYVADGIFQTQEEIDNSAVLIAGTKPGDVRYKDISGPNGVPDGKISSEYDRTFLGSSQPQFMYGINGQFAYKNFDLGIALQGIGKQNTNIIDQLLPNEARWQVIPTEILNNYWSMYNTEAQNREAQYPRLSETTKTANYANIHH